MESGYLLNGMCATNGLHSCFGEAEVFHLACLNQFLYRSGYIFNRHVRVHTVLVEEIDHINLKPLQRAFYRLLDVLRMAVQGHWSLLSLRVEFLLEVETELGGDHHLIAQRSQRFSNKFLVHERTIDLCCIKERHALLNGRPQKRDHLLLISCRAIGHAHAHAAESDG